MDNFRRLLIKIIIFTLIVAIISASVADAKKSKKHTSKASKRHFEHQLEKFHNKVKRSTYSRNWGKSNYGNYGLPPYLVYNRKLGAYYPYFKYPENNIRRSMRKTNYNSRKYS